MFELFRERDGGVGAVQDQLPPTSAQRVLEAWRQSEDALPDDSWARAATRQRRDLNRTPAVCEHDVHRIASQLPPESSNARKQGTWSEVRPPDERLQLVDSTPVERERERDDAIFAPEQIESAREFERGHLGAPAVAARHEME